MLHIKFTRAFSDGKRIPVERDASAIDAVLCINSDFDFGGVIVELSAEKVVTKTPVMGMHAHDFNTYTGSAEDMVPVLEAAYFNLLRREQNVQHIELVLGDRASRAQVFYKLAAEDVPWRALAIGLPLGIEEPADMCVLLAQSRRMDVRPIDLHATYEAWRREGGGILEVFTRRLGYENRRRSAAAA
jgi:hypothetical protein